MIRQAISFQIQRSGTLFGNQWNVITRYDYGPLLLSLKHRSYSIGYLGEILGYKSSPRRFSDAYEQYVLSEIVLTMVMCVGVRRSVRRLERALAHTRHEPRATTPRHPRPPPGNKHKTIMFSSHYTEKVILTARGQMSNHMWDE